jgi:hypothetical protein
MLFLDLQIIIHCPLIVVRGNREKGISSKKVEPWALDQRKR